MNVTLLESIAKDLRRFLVIFGILRMNKNRETLYAVAFDSIGKDVSPEDRAPDELSCAEQLSRIIQKAFPEINFPTFLSTRDLYAYLMQSPSFGTTTEPEAGDIIISVTGTGNGKVKHGHCGIVGKSWIMSNHSQSGTWEANYQLPSWKRYFEDRGGMPTLFFSPL